MQSQGIDINLYMQYTGMNAEAMRAQFKENAERQVKTRLALEKIVSLENIEASEEDLDKEYERIAEVYKIEKEQVKERVDINMVKEDVEVRKAVEFIKANAAITETEKTLAEFEEELRKHNQEHHGHDHDDDDHDHDDFDEDEDADE
jgi:trigger factor